MKKINLLKFIHKHNEEIGWPPTVREIQSEFGMSSTSVADYWINKLVNAGVIEREPGVARGLRITAEGYLALRMAIETD